MLPEKSFRCFFPILCYTVDTLIMEVCRMKYAVKNKKKVVLAYPLGAGHPMEAMLIEEGAIQRLPDGSYALFSQEAVNGHGQIAQAGDYFKVDTIDGRHFPYPNDREFFLSNHIHLGGDEYEQINKPLLIWQRGDELTEEVRWLVDMGRLTLKPQDPTHYFNAFLWGADLSAADDATMVFYSVDRDENGTIADISFNFVAKPEFEACYSILGE